MARTANKPATVATVAVAAATPTSAALRAANAHKYANAKQGKALPCANVRYTLTALGAATAAAGGAGKSGKPTVMGIVAVAAAYCQAKGKPLTGANIAAAMQVLPNCRAAIGSSKAVKYAANGQYCNGWLSGYIVGAARSAHGLLVVATA